MDFLVQLSLLLLLCTNLETWWKLGPRAPKYLACAKPHAECTKSTGTQMQGSLKDQVEASLDLWSQVCMLVGVMFLHTYKRWEGTRTAFPVQVKDEEKVEVQA